MFSYIKTNSDKYLHKTDRKTDIQVLYTQINFDTNNENKTKFFIYLRCMIKQPCCHGPPTDAGGRLHPRLAAPRPQPSDGHCVPLVV